MGVKRRGAVCWPQRCQPRCRSKAGTICTYWAVSPSKSGEKRRKGAPSGGAPNFSSQQDHSADAMVDGEVLHRCASSSGAGAWRLQWPMRDRLRCVRCRRVEGRHVFDFVHI